MRILLWPHPTLSQVAAPVTLPVDPTLIAELMTVVQRYNALGLAAPQVGVSQRLILVRMTNPETSEPMLRVLINPVITATSVEREMGWEGCLSFLDVVGQVERAVAVTVDHQLSDGATAVMQLKGLEARIVQHEVDHLDGVMFHQRVGRQQRRYLLRQYEKRLAQLERSKKLEEVMG